MKPTNPEMVDVEQFASLADALDKVRQTKPFDDLAKKSLTTYIERGGTWNITLLFFQSAVTRARGVHEAIVREIEMGNPHSAIALIRQLAETLAMTFYVSDHPAYVEVLSTRPEEQPRGAPNRKTMQKLVSYMDKHHTDQSGIVYADLCEMTHFGSSALWSPHQSVERDEQGVTISWSSAPKWKTEHDALVCCALLKELAGAMEQALIRLGKTLLTLIDVDSTHAP